MDGVTDEKQVDLFQFKTNITNMYQPCREKTYPDLHPFSRLPTAFFMFGFSQWSCLFGHQPFQYNFPRHPKWPGDNFNSRPLGIADVPLADYSWGPQRRTVKTAGEETHNKNPRVIRHHETTKILPRCFIMFYDVLCLQGRTEWWCAKKHSWPDGVRCFYDFGGT